MTDIIERLRNPPPMSTWTSLMNEAADEIGRLRSQNDAIDLIERARSKSPYLSGSSAERLIDELADEIERMRSALQEIVLRYDTDTDEMYGPAEDMRGIARRALEPKT